MAVRGSAVHNNHNHTMHISELSSHNHFVFFRAVQKKLNLTAILLCSCINTTLKKIWFLPPIVFSIYHKICGTNMCNRSLNWNPVSYMLLKGQKRVQRRNLKPCKRLWNCQKQWLINAYWMQYFTR